MANANGARRVVVTGTGVVTPIGLNVPDFWASMKVGKCGVSELGGFPLEDLKIPSPRRSRISIPKCN